MIRIPRFRIRNTGANPVFSLFSLDPDSALNLIAAPDPGLAKKSVQTLYIDLSQS